MSPHSTSSKGRKKHVARTVDTASSTAERIVEVEEDADDEGEYQLRSRDQGASRESDEAVSHSLPSVQETSQASTLPQSSQSSNDSPPTFYFTPVSPSPLTINSAVRLVLPTKKEVSQSSPRSRFHSPIPQQPYPYSSLSRRSSHEENLDRLQEELEEEASGRQRRTPSPPKGGDAGRSGNRYEMHSADAVAVGVAVGTTIQTRAKDGLARIQIGLSSLRDVLICLWKERLLIPFITTVLVFILLVFLVLSFFNLTSGISSVWNVIGGAIWDFFSAVTQTGISVFHLAYTKSLAGIESVFHSTVGDSSITNITILLSVTSRLFLAPFMFTFAQASTISTQLPTNITYYKAFHYVNAAIAKPLVDYNHLFTLANEADFGAGWLYQVSVVANEAANSHKVKIDAEEKAFLLNLVAKNRKLAEALKKPGPFLGNFIHTRNFILKQVARDLHQTHSWLESLQRWEMGDAGIIQFIPWIMKRERNLRLKQINSIYMSTMEFSLESARRLQSIAEEGLTLLTTLERTLKDIESILPKNMDLYHHLIDSHPTSSSSSFSSPEPTLLETSADSLYGYTVYTTPSAVTSTMTMLQPWQFSDGRSQQEHLGDRKKQLRSIAEHAKSVEKSMKQVTHSFGPLITKLEAAHEALLVIGPCSPVGAMYMRHAQSNKSSTSLVPPRDCSLDRSWIASQFLNGQLSILAPMLPHFLTPVPVSHTPSMLPNVTYVLDTRLVDTEEIKRQTDGVAKLRRAVAREEEYGKGLEERRKQARSKLATKKVTKKNPKKGRKGKK